MSKYHLRKSKGLCTRCGVNPYTEINHTCAKCNEWYRQYRKTHKIQRIAYTTQWRKDNPERAHAANLRHSCKQHGLTSEEYLRIVKVQNNLCIICNRPNQINKRLFIDHDHKTGIPRGVVCVNCNVHLGWLDKYMEKINLHLSSNIRSNVV